MKNLPVLALYAKAAVSLNCKSVMPASEALLVSTTRLKSAVLGWPDVEVLNVAERTEPSFMRNANPPCDAVIDKTSFATNVVPVGRVTE